MKSQQGQVAVEYLAACVFFMAIVLGSAGQPGVADLFLSALRQGYGDFSRGLSEMDAIP